MVALRAAASWAHGLVAVADADLPGATAALRASLRHWQVVAAPYEAASVRLDLARVLLSQGEPEVARVEAEVALGAFARLGARRDHDAAASFLDDLG